MKAANYAYGFRMLLRKDMAIRVTNSYYLTEKGLEEGKRITRIHRLWEMYLTEKLNIATDHVHDDAEAIEHIITPEIEKRLIELLDHPEKDPHEKVIPY